MSSPVAEKERTHTGTAIILDLASDNTDSLLSKPAHPSVEYKKHSLAAHYWGGIPQTEREWRRVSAAESQATILRGLLDTPTDHVQENPTDWLVSVALHILIVGAVVLAPLAFTQAIDLRAFRLMYLTMPKPPAAAPAPRPPALQQAVRRMLRPPQAAVLTAPSLIPRRIAVVKDEPDIAVAGVIGGIPDGESGGVLGGILGGTQVAPAPPPPPPAPTKTVYRVGGVVRPPREITTVQPHYPMMARQAHIEGVVVIDAVIDEHGNVVQARVVSGPALLIRPALEAYLQWKYEPTYLNGTPVSIRMEAQVYFHLH
jgi:protein TonB